MSPSFPGVREMGGTVKAMKMSTTPAIVKKRGMAKLFEELLTGVASEITLRVPGHWARHGVPALDIEGAAHRYAGREPFRAYAQSELERAFGAGIEQLRGCGVRFSEPTSSADGVSTLLADSIVDAFAASRGDLDVMPCPAVQRTGPIQYESCRSARGIRYARAGQGPRDLLLVNACGMPLSLWSALLNDETFPARILVVETKSVSLEHGGMREAGDIERDADAIESVLDDAGVEQAALVAWCSGGRLALEVAARLPEKVASLTLVSPTMRGIAQLPPCGTAFEDDLNRIFEAVASQPVLAPHLAVALRERVSSASWTGARGEAGTSWATLFSLPAQQHMASLVAPMVQPEFLVNYGERVLRDQRHAVHTCLERVRAPLLLVTGDHDDRVDNDFTREALRKFGPPFLAATISGAGHYVYDLQYSQFRAALVAFLDGREPQRSARMGVGRVDVARLGRPRGENQSSKGAQR